MTSCHKSCIYECEFEPSQFFARARSNDFLSERPRCSVSVQYYILCGSVYEDVRLAVVARRRQDVELVLVRLPHRVHEVVQLHHAVPVPLPLPPPATAQHLLHPVAHRLVQRRLLLEQELLRVQKVIKSKSEDGARMISVVKSDDSPAWCAS